MAVKEGIMKYKQSLTDAWCTAYKEGESSCLPYLVTVRHVGTIFGRWHPVCIRTMGEQPR